jgi:hypothetical protein
MYSVISRINSPNKPAVIKNITFPKARLESSYYLEA